MSMSLALTSSIINMTRLPEVRPDCFWKAIEKPSGLLAFEKYRQGHVFAPASASMSKAIKTPNCAFGTTYRYA
jgi:hypothetical protein